MYVAQCEVTCYIKALKGSLFVFNISFHCFVHASYDTSALLRALAQSFNYESSQSCVLPLVHFPVHTP
jgi:hypothetical protein